MSRFTRVAVALAFGMTFTSAPALGQDVLGRWATVAQTPMGEFTSTMSLIEGADGFVVEMVEAAPAGPGAAEAGAMPQMASTISNVVVDGNTLSFDRSMETPQGPMELSYRFTAEGDSLTGEATSSFGAIPITGTRAAGQ